MIKIALVGDQSDEVTAHRAIPVALQLAAEKLNIKCTADWIHSTKVDLQNLKNYHGIWCVPASPYQNPENVIASICHARQSGTAFIGTCGGYQHAAIEFARNVLGFSDATSIEDNPQASMPLISSMFCAMREKPGQIKLTEPSRIQSIYKQTIIEEQYNCGFGINADYLSIFDNTDLLFTGHSIDKESADDPRALELANHPFFIACAFQPERSALAGRAHPLIESFLTAST